MIKADLKHGGGRRGVNGPYEISYPRFAEQAHNKLGNGGVVGIPNARGEDNSLGAEYRSEELFNLANNFGDIIPFGDGRVFYDTNYDIYFVKSQEINSQLNEKKLTYLVFNIPFGHNFNEINNESFDDPDTINVLNLPSCIDQIKEPLNPAFLAYFNGIVVHESSAAILRGANKYVEEFYEDSIKGKIFSNCESSSHYIGAISVSGGHRSPKENLIQKIVSPVSVGSSYTCFPEFEGNNLTDFNRWLKESIESSQDADKLVRGSSARETLFKHLPRMIRGVINGERKTVF